MSAVMDATATLTCEHGPRAALVTTHQAWRGLAINPCPWTLTWTVTHMATGLAALSGLATERAAELAADHLAALDWTGEITDEHTQAIKEASRGR